MIIFNCRDSDMKTFQLTVESVQEAIKALSDYEKQTGLNVRHYEKGTGKRIIGGELGYLPKELEEIPFCK